MKKLFFICFCIITTSYANKLIEQNLKPCLNKENVNTIDGIDFIYMINMDARPEKFLESIEQLQKYDIIPYRFSAVNGWEIPIEIIQKLGVIFKPGMKEGLLGTYYNPENNGKPSHEIIHQVGKPYLSHCLSRGAIGIVLSHLSILKDAIDSGYETIWVMEDDIDIKNDPHILSRFINDLDVMYGRDGGDVLFTDPDTKNNNNEYVPCFGAPKRPNFTPKNPRRFKKRRNITIDLKQIGARFGAYSMIIRKSGIKKIYNFINDYSLFLPYDLEFFQPNDIKMFSTKRDIVSTKLHALSDNGAPYYLSENQ